MGYSNGIITLPINVQGDIGTALGRATGDVGQLCGDVRWNSESQQWERAYSINKWARYKPVINYGLDYSSQMNSAKTAWLPTSDWWKDKNGHCGLTIEEFTDLGDPFSSTQNTFLYKLRNGQLPWDYEPPTGIVGVAPYRVFDFFQYYKDAECPLSFEGLPNTYQLDIYGSLTMSLGDVATEEDHTLGLGDFLLRNKTIPVTDMYLGVLLWRQDGTYHVLTSADKLSTGANMDVTIDDATSLVGKWYLIPFLSSVKYELGDSLVTGLYTSAFDITSNRAVTIAAYGSNVNLDNIFGQWASAASTSIDYELIILNYGSARTLTGVTIYLVRTPTPTWDASRAVTVNTVSIGSVAMGAGTSDNPASASRAGTITGITRDSNYTYWLYAIANPGTGQFTGEPQQIEEYISPIDE